MIRITISIILVLVASGLLITSLMLTGDNRAGDVLLNLGTEVVGIALTVAIVDWLIERHRFRDEAEKAAWRLLHDIDQAVWIWQGGRREFNLDELASLLRMIEPDDVISDPAREMLVTVGSHASDELRLHHRIFRFEGRLGQAVGFLTGLAQLRELGASVNNEFIVESLERSVTVLAAIVKQPVAAGTSGVARTYRDSSLDAQHDRYRRSLARTRAAIE